MGSYTVKCSVSKQEKAEWATTESNLKCYFNSSLSVLTQTFLSDTQKAVDTAMKQLRLPGI